MTSTDTRVDAAQPASASAEAVERARIRLAEGLRAGVDGVALAATFSAGISDVVRAVVEPLFAAEGAPRGAGLAAIGALGRNELGPYSDLDLVVVLDGVPDGGEAALGTWMQRWQDPLWQAGLKVVATAHDPRSWAATAAEDLTLCTALLDARHVAGAEGPLERLRALAGPELFGDRRGELLRRLRTEVDERHARYGGTVYRVEPDLKHGPGGLRDLAVTGWCLLATHGHRDLDSLVGGEVLGPRVGELLGRARDVLLRLRAALQLAARRPQDRLVFQYQEQMPALLGMVDEDVEDAALVAAIESFMQDYFRAAITVRRYGRRVCEGCMPAVAAPAEDRRLDERFHVVGDRLEHYGADPFAETPVLALEALALARDQHVRLSGATFDCIAEAVAAPAAQGLAGDPEAQRRLLDLLIAPDDAGDPPVLDLCNELGLLERVVPEFGPAHGRMQHDTFHVYTVDQHTLNAVAFLKSIARGEHRKDFPLATVLHLEIEDPRVLYLAMLAHDLGKPLGGDQCEVGAEVARAVARRAGLAAAAVERCAFLVGEHLTMPLLSQKRDLGDPLLIEQFADKVGTRECLGELYLLSLADMAQVRPGNLTSWKRTLLDELYLMAAAHLRGHEVRRPSAGARPGAPQGLPDRYHALFDVEMRRHHAELVERVVLGERPVLLDLARGAGALRLTVVARDRPGLLAQIAAALDDRGMTVMAADVFSVPGDPAVVLDVFRLEPRGDAELSSTDLAELERVLAPALDAAALRTPPPPVPRSRWKVARRIPTRISFGEDPSGARTIVEVDTADRPGVLRRITLAFASLGVEVLLARCLTEAERASDVFYVSALDEATRERLAARLAGYLGST